MQQLYEQWGSKEERSSSGFAEHFFQVQVTCRNTREVQEVGGNEEGGDAGIAAGSGTSGVIGPGTGSEEKLQPKISPETS